MGLDEDRNTFGPRIWKRDVKNLSRSIQGFLSKLPYNPIASKLRDALLFAALQLSRYSKTQSKSSLSESCSFPSGLMKLLNTSYPDLDFDHFNLKWEQERDNSSLKRTQPPSPPLCATAASGDFNGLEELLKTDPGSVNSVDRQGRSALSYCCRHASPDHMTCLEMLLQYNPALDLRDREGSTALHWAVYAGNADAVSSLLKHGAAYHLADRHRRTPLHLAALSDNSRVLQLLLQQKGADVTVKDARGMTPLFWACAKDNLDALAALQLAESNTSLNSHATDTQGRTLLHWSALSPYGTTCLESLIVPENSYSPDKLGWSPLHYTALTGSQKACDTILDVLPRDQIDSPTPHGFSALHIACYHGNGDVLDSLLSNDCDFRSHTPENISPLEAVTRLQLHYCQLVLETHIGQPRRTGTPRSASEKPTGIPNHLQNSLTPTPPRSPKPPASPKMPRTPMRHHLKANTGNSRPVSRSIPPPDFPTPPPSADQNAFAAKSRPVSAKGRIRPMQKRPSSPAPPHRISSTPTPPSPSYRQVDTGTGMKRTLSFDLNLDLTDQFSALSLPARPHAPTPPAESDAESIVISEASSAPPLSPEEIETASSMLGLPIQKRHSLRPMSDVWNDSGFISPGNISKSQSSLNIRKLRPPLTPSHSSLRYDPSPGRPPPSPYNMQTPSPYNQNITLPNTPQSKRSVPNIIPQSPPAPVFPARASTVPRYKAWKPTKESLPTQRPIIRMSRNEASMGHLSNFYNH